MPDSRHTTGFQGTFRRILSLTTIGRLYISWRRCAVDLKSQTRLGSSLVCMEVYIDHLCPYSKRKEIGHNTLMLYHILLFRVSPMQDEEYNLGLTASVQEAER